MQFSEDLHIIPQVCWHHDTTNVVNTLTGLRNAQTIMIIRFENHIFGCQTCRVGLKWAHFGIAFHANCWKFLLFFNQKWIFQARFSYTSECCCKFGLGVLRPKHRPIQRTIELGDRTGQTENIWKKSKIHEITTGFLPLFRFPSIFSWIFT